MTQNASTRQQAIQLFNKAYRAQARGYLDRAVGLYRQSIECCPTAEAHTFLGWVYGCLGHLEEAIEECHKAIAVNPELGNPYNDIGAYLIKQGKLDEAIPWLNEALTAPCYDCHSLPHMNLARIYERQSKWSLALEHYKLALKYQPDYKAAARGLAHLRGLMN